jgi:molecular chaperone GrpE
MADENNEMGEDAEAVALDLDNQTEDLDAAMRDAVAAVEGVGGDRKTPPASDNDEEEVANLRREIADLRDRTMRTLADFDNFRKRSERERQDVKRYALMEPLREFVEIVDNLGLALSAAGSAEDLKRGVEMIHRQMHDLLRRFGVKEIEALNQPFDPVIHEAVSREEDSTVDKPTVVGELRRGYMLHERLLRPSMVKVAVPAEAKPAG